MSVGGGGGLLSLTSACNFRGDIKQNHGKCGHDSRLEKLVTVTVDETVV
jgi:hypothetical protein